MSKQDQDSIAPCQIQGLVGYPFFKDKMVIIQLQFGHALSSLRWKSPLLLALALLLAPCLTSPLVSNAWHPCWASEGRDWGRRLQAIPTWNLDCWWVLTSCIWCSCWDFARWVSQIPNSYTFGLCTNHFISPTELIPVSVSHGVSLKHIKSVS